MSKPFLPNAKQIECGAISSSRKSGRSDRSSSGLHPGGARPVSARSRVCQHLLGDRERSPPLTEARRAAPRPNWPESASED